MRAEPHEKRDVPGRAFTALAVSYVAVVAIGALAALVTQKLFLRLLSRADAGRPSLVNVLPPEPRLEADNQAELAKLRAEEDDLLANYRWIDRKRGIARIPIDRAVELALEKRR